MYDGFNWMALDTLSIFGTSLALFRGSSREDGRSTVRRPGSIAGMAPVEEPRRRGVPATPGASRP
jgi:hypothetical protein